MAELAADEAVSVAEDIIDDEPEEGESVANLAS